MARSIKSIKPPNYLAKNLVLLIISGSILIYMFLAVAPVNPFVVVIMLVILFGFLIHLISTVWFFIRYRGQQRVWYLKADAFSKIYTKSLFISLFICLTLLLQYVGQLNWITFLVLVVFLACGYFVTVRGEKEENGSSSISSLRD